MSDLLITIGDSFTYGEGLEYYIWKEKYNNSYEIFKPIQDNNYPVKRVFQSTNQEFIDFRIFTVNQKVSYFLNFLTLIIISKEYLIFQTIQVPKLNVQ